VNTDRDRALLELSRRNPFWVCLVVFALIAADNGFRLANSIDQRNQLDQAQLVQAQNVGRMSETLANMPQIEAKLQALSLDLIQVANTNLTAKQIVREFNIQWNPGPESVFSSPALPPELPASPTPQPSTLPASITAPSISAPDRSSAKNTPGSAPAATVRATNAATRK
jgi:hypothetical protein